VLVGRRQGRVWFGRLVRHSQGSPTSVRFDAGWVLRREERRGDVVGFYHTHPPRSHQLSARDVRTMRAWCGCFGKPLLCVIASQDDDGVRHHGWRFQDDACDGVPVGVLEVFRCHAVRNGVVVAVE
jgi:proteasome lid subunit RPN8/RPN11